MHFKHNTSSQECTFSLITLVEMSSVSPEISFLTNKAKVCRTRTNLEEINFGTHTKIIVTKDYLSSIWSHSVK